MEPTFKNMTDLETAVSFVEFIPVKTVFEQYNTWQEEKQALEKQLSTINNVLGAGGLSRQIRTLKVKKRNKLQQQLIDNDPRMLERECFDLWLMIIGVDESDLPATRTIAAKRLENAMLDADGLKETNIPPFSLMRTGTGSKDHYKIMDLKDYVLFKFKDKSRKDTQQIKSQRKRFNRYMVTVEQIYGTIPKEMKVVSDIAELTLEFNARVSGIQGDLMEEKLRELENQTMDKKQLECVS